MKASVSLQAGGNEWEALTSVGRDLADKGDLMCREMLGVRNRGTAVLTSSTDPESTHDAPSEAMLGPHLLHDRAELLICGRAILALHPDL